MAAPFPIGNWQFSLDQVLQDLIEKSDEFDRFSSLETNRDRIDFIIKRKLIRSVDWLPVYFDGCDKGHDKSVGVAEVWKNKGNKHFQQGKFHEALADYTQACITGPSKKGNILALSFGNRSAALFHLSHYKACVADVDRALKLGFPSASRHKVLLRKVDAFCKLGDKAKAISGMDVLKEFIETKEFKLTGDQRDTFLKDVEKLQTKIESLSETESHSVDEEKPERLSTLFEGTSNVVSQATSAVSLKFFPTKGRHLVANEDIPQGSPIIIEKPFSAVLLPDHYDYHCHHCLAKLPWNPIGCELCSHVQFCDETCRDLAMSSYHRVECNYLYLLHSIGIAHLSLRTVLLSGLDFLKEFLLEKQQHGNIDVDKMKGINSQGVYDGSYLPVYHLMTHEDVTNPQDLLQYSLTAVLLLATLVHSGYLDRELGGSNVSVSKQRRTLLRNFFYGTSTTEKVEDLPSDILDVGSLLLRHILQLVCNAHAITSLESPPSPYHPGVDRPSDNGLVEDVEQVRIATAIYPTASLMNHSCDPTIVSSFQKDVLTVKTVKQVKKGEEIFNCYGPHSRRMSTAERQEVLQSQYHFVCDCKACCSETLAHLRFGAFKCQECCGILLDTSCTECGVSVSPKQMQAKRKREKQLRQDFENGVLALKDKRYTSALGQLTECLRGRKRLLYKDHRDLALCEDSIARCHAGLGEYSISADHLYKSVEFSKAIYGSESVEYGHEIQKLSEVLFTAERLSECLEMAQKAYHILRGAYAEGHASLRQLEGLIMTTTVGLTPQPNKK